MNASLTVSLAIMVACTKCSLCDCFGSDPGNWCMQSCSCVVFKYLAYYLNTFTWYSHFLSDYFINQVHDILCSPSLSATNSNSVWALGSKVSRHPSNIAIYPVLDLLTLYPCVEIVDYSSTKILIKIYSSNVSFGRSIMCMSFVFIMYRISCLFVYLGLAANWSYVYALSGLVDYLRKLSFHSIFLYYHGCLCVDPSRPLWLLLLYRAGISIGFVRAFNPIIISIWIINTGCDSSKRYSQVIINLPSFVISNLFSRLNITCSSFADDLAAKMQSFV